MLFLMQVRISLDRDLLLEFPLKFLDSCRSSSYIMSATAEFTVMRAFFSSASMKTRWISENLVAEGAGLDATVSRLAGRNRVRFNLRIFEK